MQYGQKGAGAQTVIVGLQVKSGKIAKKSRKIGRKFFDVQEGAVNMFILNGGKYDARLI